MTVADAVSETSDTPSATHTLHTAPSNSIIDYIFVLSRPDIDHLRMEGRGGELDSERSYLFLSSPTIELLFFNVYPAVTQ